MCQLNEKPKDRVKNPSSGDLTDARGGKNEIRDAFMVFGVVKGEEQEEREKKKKKEKTTMSTRVE